MIVDLIKGYKSQLLELKYEQSGDLRRAESQYAEKL